MRIVILILLICPIALYSQIVKPEHCTWEKVLSKYPNIKQKIYTEGGIEFLINTSDSIAIDRKREVQLFNLDSGCLIIEKMDNEKYYSNIYYFNGGAIIAVSYPLTEAIKVTKKKKDLNLEIRYLYKNKLYKDCYYLINTGFIKMDKCQ